jgi:hypothetical protein
MYDIYEEALKKLRADKRTLNELERAIGLPAETIRDIKERITRSPRLDTVKKIVRHYEREAA